jgi:hypothetical protein
MSAETAVLAGGEKGPMNTITRYLGRRLGALGLAVLLALALAGDRGRAATVPAAIYGQDPLEILELKVRPNVVVVLDSSGSMTETTAGVWYPNSGDHPGSKLFQGKAVLNQIIADNQDKVNFMLAQYFQAGVGFKECPGGTWSSGPDTCTDGTGWNPPKYKAAGAGRFQYAASTSAPILRAVNDTADRGFQSWQDIRAGWNRIHYRETLRHRHPRCATGTSRPSSTRRARPCGRAPTLAMTAPAQSVPRATRTPTP